MYGGERRGARPPQDRRAGRHSSGRHARTRLALRRDRHPAGHAAHRFGRVVRGYDAVLAAEARPAGECRPAPLRGSRPDGRLLSHARRASSSSYGVHWSSYKKCMLFSNHETLKTSAAQRRDLRRASRGPPVGHAQDAQVLAVCKARSRSPSTGTPIDKLDIRDMQARARRREQGVCPAVYRPHVDAQLRSYLSTPRPGGEQWKRG